MCFREKLLCNAQLIISRPYGFGKDKLMKTRCLSHRVISHILRSNRIAQNNLGKKETSESSGVFFYNIPHVSTMCVFISVKYDTEILNYLLKSLFVLLIICLYITKNNILKINTM